MFLSRSVAILKFLFSNIGTKYETEELLPGCHWLWSHERVYNAHHHNSLSGKAILLKDSCVTLWSLLEKVKISSLSIPLIALYHSPSEPNYFSWHVVWKRVTYLSQAWSIFVDFTGTRIIGSSCFLLFASVITPQLLV